jgi:hypothetical protein
VSTCKYCGKTDLVWHENLHANVDPITKKVHGKDACRKGYCDSCRRTFVTFHEAFEHMLKGPAGLHSVHAVE